MRELVFFLEERSAAAMLEGLLPKLLPDDVVPRYVTFEGKQDHFIKETTASIRNPESSRCGRIRTRRGTE